MGRVPRWMLKMFTWQFLDMTSWLLSFTLTQWPDDINFRDSKVFWLNSLFFLPYFFLSLLLSFTYSCFSGVQSPFIIFFLFPLSALSLFSTLHIDFYPLCIFCSCLHRKWETHIYASPHNLFIKSRNRNSPYLSNLSREGTIGVVELCVKLLFPKEDLGGEYWLSP